MLLYSACYASTNNILVIKYKKPMYCYCLKAIVWRNIWNYCKANNQCIFLYEIKCCNFNLLRVYIDKNAEFFSHRTIQSMLNSFNYLLQPEGYSMSWSRHALVSLCLLVTWYVYVLTVNLYLGVGKHCKQVFLLVFPNFNLNIILYLLWTSFYIKVLISFNVVEIGVVSD